MHYHWGQFLKKNQKYKMNVLFFTKLLIPGPQEGKPERSFCVHYNG